MKVLSLLIIFISIFISQCHSFANNVFSVYNANNTAVVGIVDLYSNTYNPKVILQGFQHIPNSNQFSTYNQVTKQISYLVSSNTDGSVYLYTTNTDSWNSGSAHITFQDWNVLSIESMQSTQTADIFIVMENKVTLGGLIVAMIDYNNGTYQTVDSIGSGLNFSSASYDQQNNMFVSVFTNAQGQFIVNCYSSAGAKVSSTIYTTSNLNPSYRTYSGPTNLVYIPHAAAFYCDIAIGQTAYSAHAQFFQLYAANKSFYLTPTLSSNFCNSNPSGMVGFIDTDGNYVALQLFACGTKYSYQKFSITTGYNLGTYPLTYNVINAWTLVN